MRRLFTLLFTFIVITGTMGALLYSNICNIVADDSVIEDQKNGTQIAIDDYDGIFKVYQKNTECGSINSIGPSIFGDYIVYVITNDKYLYEIRFYYDDLNRKVIRLFFDDLTEDVDSWIAAIRKTLFKDNKLSKDEKNELKKIKDGEKVTIRGYNFNIGDVGDKYITSKKKYLEIDFPEEEKIEETKDTNGEQQSNTEKEKIKKNQEIEIDVNNVTIDSSELQSINKTVDKSDIFTIKNAKGKVTFKKKTGSDCLDISKNGELTIAAGTDKGEYSLSVLVKASGDEDYDWTSQVVDIVVVVNGPDIDQEPEEKTGEVSNNEDTQNDTEISDLSESTTSQSDKAKEESIETLSIQEVSEQELSEMEIAESKELETLESAKVDQNTEEANETSVSEKQILFRGITWGTKMPEVQEILNKEGDDNASGLLGLKHEMQNLRSAGIDYTVDELRVPEAGDRGWFYNINLAGYTTEETYTFYIYPIKDGQFVRSEDEAEFYFGYYLFRPGALSDYVATYDDLKSKLSSLYGEGVETEEYSSIKTKWTDKYGNKAVLSRSLNYDVIYLGYIAGDADERLREAKAIIDAEALEAENIKREQNADNNTGL